MYYQQPYNFGYQEMRPYQQPVQQNTDERIWVQGVDAARAYLVAPNSFVRLWDSQSPVFYEKRADQTGRPYMEAYRYEKQEEQTPTQKQVVDYSGKIKALEDRISALERSKNEQSYSDDSGV